MLLGKRSLVNTVPALIITPSSMVTAVRNAAVVALAPADAVSVQVPAPVARSWPPETVHGPEVE